MVVAEPEPEPEPPPPQPGRLNLTGLPEGAVVLVGGRVRQGTNIPLSPARYRLVVRADGYEDYAQDVRIIAGQRNDVAVPVKMPGRRGLLHGDRRHSSAGSDPPLFF